MRKILSILILVLFYNSVYPQWHSVENGSSGSITRVTFQNTNTGYYIGGEFNLIYKTINGGLNWQGIDIPNIFPVEGMFELLNYGDTLFTSTGKNLIKSTNGGNTWIEIIPNINGNYYAIQRINPGILFTIISPPSSTNLLAKSTDGGSSWISIPVPTPTTNSFYFINEQLGYMLDEQNIYKTSNGGNNWHDIYTHPISLNGGKFKTFINDSTGFLESNLRLYRTQNGGISWDSLGYFVPRKIIFTNQHTGYMVGRPDSSVLFKTTNSGMSWQRKFTMLMPGSGREFTDLSITGNTFYISANAGGGLFKSTDSGESWKDISQYSNSFSFKSVYQVDNLVSFAGGDQSGLFYTSNGGINWQENMDFKNTTNTKNRLINDIQFIGNTGWIGSDTGLFKSPNGGINWTYIPNFVFRCDKIQFFDENTGLVLARKINLTPSKTWLFRTTDGGNTFDSIHTFNIASFSDMQFFPGSSGQYGFLTADEEFNDSNLFRTTNGGLNWQKISFGNLGCVEIINENISFVGGKNSHMLFKTTNGGNNWTEVFQTTLGSWMNLKFINESTGYAINSNDSTLFYTTNGGIIWIYQNIGSQINLRDININLNGMGFIVGDYGKIYRTTNYGGIVSVTPVSEEIPDYMLHQNFPNPFNPITRIKFAIPKSGSVRLRVYDQLGREVRTLVNEELFAGSYEYEFDGSGLASGVYFYRLESGEYVETRRMVILK